MYLGWSIKILPHCIPSQWLQEYIHSLSSFLPGGKKNRFLVLHGNVACTCLQSRLAHHNTRCSKENQFVKCWLIYDHLIISMLVYDTKWYCIPWSVGGTKFLTKECYRILSDKMWQSVANLRVDRSLWNQ